MNHMHPSSCPCQAKRSAQRKSIWTRALWWASGCFALLWFLIRVIPKPTRATYPCQRAAFPIASSFVAYLLGGGVIAAAFKKAQRHTLQSRYLLAACCVAVGITTAGLMMGVHARQTQAKSYTPPDPANSPIGTAQGLYPGRVVWSHDPNATTWDPTWNDREDIFYWDDEHTDQNQVDGMMSDCVRALTGEESDPNAWDSLFRYFNWIHDQNEIGYTPGEKIAIKPNHVEHRKLDYQVNYADLAPQMVVALLKQLVVEANVPQEDITICDSSRYISNKTYDRCTALFPRVHYRVTNFYKDYGDDRDTDPCRPPVTPSKEPLIHYSGLNDKAYPTRAIPSDYLPQPFVDAKYVINLAVMKGHNSAGVTLCGKNWYGSFCCPPGNSRSNDAHHQMLPGTTPTMGHYRPMVDLMGHQHLGGKTLLFILDGLWGFPKHGKNSRPTRWQSAPFNDDYPSCLLMSQDMVAIDSVGLDFLRTEFGDNMGTSGISGGIDDYLHEAALAYDPPSGTFYDPEADGIGLSSLGVHEHWNNALDKQYSRNLDPNEPNGIELICVSQEP